MIRDANGNQIFSRKFERMFSNKKVEAHWNICKKLNSVYEKKNHDYGDSFGETYRKLGIISAVTRISDKVNRLQNLVGKDCSREVLDEPIEDTLLDLANYSIMTVMELRGGADVADGETENRV